MVQRLKSQFSLPLDITWDLLSTLTPLTYSRIILIPCIPIQMNGSGVKTTAIEALTYIPNIPTLYILAISSVNKLPISSTLTKNLKTSRQASI
uniref:Uncharacterized protein n=1 Tax=Setaria italica TaxID=4555 RepID=K3XNN9_SETIT